MKRPQSSLRNPNRRNRGVFQKAETPVLEEVEKFRLTASEIAELEGLLMKTQDRLALFEFFF